MARGRLPHDGRCTILYDEGNDEFIMGCGGEMTTADGIPEDGEHCSKCGRLIDLDTLHALQSAFTVAWPEYD